MAPRSWRRRRTVIASLAAASVASRARARVLPHPAAQARPLPARRHLRRQRRLSRRLGRRRYRPLRRLRGARSGVRRPRSRHVGAGRRGAVAAPTPPAPAARGGALPPVGGPGLGLGPARGAMGLVTLLTAAQQRPARGAALPGGTGLRVDTIDECAQCLPQRAAGRPLQDAASLKQAGIGGRRVIRQQDDVLQSTETCQGLTQRLLGRGPGGRGPHPVDDDLDPAAGRRGGAHLVQELEQAAHTHRVRPADHQHDIGAGHQVRGDRPASGLEREVVDVIVDDTTGDVDDGPGRGLTALEPDLGHGGWRQLPPAPGPSQPSQ